MNKKNMKIKLYQIHYWNSIENNSQNIIYYILNKGYDEFHAISDALSSGKYDFALILLERFSSISLNKLKMKN